MSDNLFKAAHWAANLAQADRVSTVEKRIREALKKAARRGTNFPEIWVDDGGDHWAVGQFPSPNKAVQNCEEGPSERPASQSEGPILSYTAERPVCYSKVSPESPFRLSYRL
jgi:hypothetical protein